MARRDTRPLPDIRFEHQSAMRSRRVRTPSHPFRVETKPFAITPVMFAPVLPGDTVKSYQFQARVLTDPLADRLAGWWAEYFTFYIKRGDLPHDHRQEFSDMLIGIGGVASGGVDTKFYQGRNSWPILVKCYSRVVQSYFRDEMAGGSTDAGDNDPYPSIYGYSAAKLNSNAWWDSLISDAEAVMEPDGSPGVPTTDPTDWTQLWTAYQGMRNARLTTATWAEYLAMQGVSTPPQLEETEPGLRRPELIRFQRDFQYPVQVVEPTTGKPAALVQWGMADRLQRARYCAEPGFLLGLMVVRPKAFLANQAGTATGYLMDQGQAWMPHALDTDPHARQRMFTMDKTTPNNTTGPVANAGLTAAGNVDYWVDPADLLNRGDQFVNVAMSGVDNINSVALPIIGGEDYFEINMNVPSEADADSMFAGTDKLVHIDGIYTFQIASRGGGTDATGRRGSW